MKAILNINNTELEVQPLADGYSVTRSDLLSGASGRSAETGRALRYLVRRNTYKLTLKFKGTAAEIAQVNELTSAFDQTVTFFDGTGYRTCVMYPGDRTMTTNGVTAMTRAQLADDTIFRRAGLSI